MGCNLTWPARPGSSSVRRVLTKLVLENFKSFRAAEIDFPKSRLTVLVGPNGCGKSTVLEAAFQALALDSVTKRAEPGGDGAKDAVRVGSQGFSVRATVEAGSAHPRARIDTQAVFRDGKTTRTAALTIEDQTKVFIPDEGVIEPFVVLGEERLSTDDLYQALPRPRYFSVNLSELRLPLQPSVGPETLTIDAELIIQRMLDMKLGSEPLAYETLVRDVRAIVPAVRQISLQRHFDVVEKYGLRFDMATGSGIPASQVSEGTLLTLALCVAARSAGQTILLIDDIDRALHPSAQRQLITFLRATVETQPIQIICTTHSPCILGEFRYDEVRVLREADGASQCIALDQGPEAARWMKELDAGEYWSFFEGKLFQNQSK